MADAEESKFDSTPEGSAKRWVQEFTEAKRVLEKWHAAAKESDDRYRDEEDREGDRLNLYAAGVDLKEATVYANVPRVDVKRRDNDQDDDVARVAAEIKKRLLNADLEREEEGFPRAIALACKDWLIPGCGLVWERLVFETEEIEAKEALMRPVVGPDGQPVLSEAGEPQTEEAAPAVAASTTTVPVDVETDHVFWKDLLWSPARVFEDLRWMGRRALLSKKSFEKKFGDEKVPLSIGADPKDNTIPATPWSRVEVWEIWDKENECVWWYVDGFAHVLIPRDPATGKPTHTNPDGSIPDPLKLRNFWPFPEPIMEGLTTSKYVPRPAYTRTQDIYNRIDDKYTRKACSSMRWTPPASTTRRSESSGTSSTRRARTRRSRQPTTRRWRRRAGSPPASPGSRLEDDRQRDDRPPGDAGGKTSS
jgi:hypothetical protein